MKISLAHLIVLALSVLGAVLLVRGCNSLHVVMHDANRIGPGTTWEERTNGLIVLGYLGLILVAIVKILSSNRRD